MPINTGREWVSVDFCSLKTGEITGKYRRRTKKVAELTGKVDELSPFGSQSPFTKIKLHPLFLVSAAKTPGVSRANFLAQKIAFPCKKVTSQSKKNPFA